MKKLLEVQKKIGAISKDSTNPFFKSQYFDINKLIEVLKPVLNEAGLVVMQPLDQIEGKAALRTLVVDATDGKTLLDYSTVLPVNPDPQKMGAIITYFRRYALQSLFLLQAQDDDAESAITRTAPPAAPKYSEGGNGGCPHCGAPMKLSKAGTVYCSAICWEKKPKAAKQEEPPPPEPTEPDLEPLPF